MSFVPAASPCWVIRPVGVPAADPLDSDAFDAHFESEAEAAAEAFAIMRDEADDARADLADLVDPADLVGLAGLRTTGPCVGGSRIERGSRIGQVGGGHGSGTARRRVLVAAALSTPCARLTCDHCGQALRDPDTGGRLHFTSHSEAANHASEAGWIEQRGLWHCPTGECVPPRTSEPVPVIPGQLELPGVAAPASAGEGGRS